MFTIQKLFLTVLILLLILITVGEHYIGFTGPICICRKYRPYELLLYRGNYLGFRDTKFGEMLFT